MLRSQFVVKIQMRVKVAIPTETQLNTCDVYGTIFMWQKEAKIDIETLNLGTTPPVFNSIRALERPPDGDHLVSFY